MHVARQPDCSGSLAERAVPQPQVVLLCEREDPAGRQCGRVFHFSIELCDAEVAEIADDLIIADLKIKKGTANDAP